MTAFIIFSILLISSLLCYVQAVKEGERDYFLRIDKKLNDTRVKYLQSNMHYSV